MNKVALRNAASRKFRLETRRRKIKEGRPSWEMIKMYAEGYGDQPSVYINVHEFQKDWLARGRRCLLDWYDKIDAERDRI